jgi:ubiquitin carboxyl-terminal hydrolase 48
MRIETLEGDNKYHCTTCNSLQEATRQLHITSIPPTLQIQVNRFVFDGKTMSKKKKNSSFLFPSCLKVSSYLHNYEGKEIWYDLRAVLLHRGTSAHSGHYIARVFDIE